MPWMSLRRGLRRDFVDLDFGVVLAMSGLLHVMLAATELDDPDFWVATVGDDGAGHLAARDEGLADFDPVIGLDQQDFFEGNFLTGFGIEGLDLHLVAGLDAVLFAASLDNSVHVQVLLRGIRVNAQFYRNASAQVNGSRGCVRPVHGRRCPFPGLAFFRNVLYKISRANGTNNKSTTLTHC
ncbi:protein of unknown function [Methylococcus capsulatus]|uniref:Uncharacterized protein n=1 Tax=Methylococcus capsulatus TaxID=414 RepID=A0AA35UIY1_METCP|nr:protein of unknown function [Methylococcus capsulatus]